MVEGNLVVENLGGKLRLFVVVVVLVSSFSSVVIFMPIPAKAGMFYVGGSGPGNYTSIQSAIDSASPGDTVFLYSGLYQESVLVDRTISIIGENRNSTVLESGSSSYVILIDADWVNITGLSVRDKLGTGLHLSNAENCSINRISIPYGDPGIYVGGSGNNSITNSTIRKSSIVISNSVDNLVADNELLDTFYGISLHESDLNSIVNNVIQDNWYGIHVRNSRANFISGNVLLNNGILLEGSSPDMWNSHNIESTNTINGKPLYYWSNRIGGQVPSDAGQVILANCSSILLHHLEVSNASTGIQAGFSSNITITDNSFVGNLIGVSLVYSDYSYIGNNSAIENRDAFYLYHSDNNTISGNVASKGDAAVRIYYSRGNNIENNIVNLSEWDAIVLFFSCNTKISRNLVESNRITAIDLHHSWSNLVDGNTILNNSDGIQLGHSDHNTVTNNNVVSNRGDGVHMWKSKGNVIYHNNFINNYRHVRGGTGINSWSNGYPLGGNYWDDYVGRDFRSGPDQNRLGGDGIGDTPHSVPDETDKDWYPLMKPLVLPFEAEGNTIPTCSIVSPPSGVTMKGVHTLSGTATDFEGLVEKVEIRVNDGEWTQVSGTVTWFYRLDTSQMVDGTHTIHARSYDGLTYSDIADIVIIVDNVPENRVNTFWIYASVAATILTAGLIVAFSIIRFRRRKGKAFPPS
ncbi:MAG: NosD domain-containing protein [Candidatus Thorarchaeota archaeon]|jgi:parallel beta-helix repeat protein